MPKFKFTLFGSPLLERDGSRIDLSLRKSLSLLAFLSVDKQIHTREDLAAMLWPDISRTTALGNLRRALYRVNHTSGDELIIANRSSVEFNQNIDLWLDVDVFYEHLQPCLCSFRKETPLPPLCLKKLIQGVELYTADFMAGFSLPDSPAFDEWQFFQMEGLRLAFHSALKCLVEQFRRTKEWDRAIIYARRRLSLDVLDESAHRDLMELYFLNDQYGAALRQYEECRRNLANELKILPEEETTLLYNKIKQPHKTAVELSPVPDINKPSSPKQSAIIISSRENRFINAYIDNQKYAEDEEGKDWKRLQPKPDAGRIKSLPGPPHNLPVQPFPFVGRKDELIQVQQLLLESSEHRLLTITGPGGIGKTRLAIEAASAVFRSFHHGVFLISLSSLQNPSDVIQAVTKQINLESFPVKVSQEHLFHFLSDKHMLLILDSYEHLISDVQFIEKLLQNAPKVKLLVTSRERLYLSSETVFSLGGMDYLEREEGDDIHQFGSVQLFIQSAKLLKPQLDLSSEDLLIVGQICRLVQGMPLAIILSAGWIQALSLKEIAEEIEHNLDFLEGIIRDLPDRHRSVRAAFEYSWKRLSKIDQTAFMQLSIFSGGFSAISAQRVTGTSLFTLRNLIDKSFISIQQDGRYQIHELLRKFGSEKLEESGEAELFRMRHSEIYLTFLADRKEDLKGRKQIAALGEIETDFRNICSAWNYALSRGKWPVVYQAIESLYLYCDLRGRHQEGAELFEIAKTWLVPEFVEKSELVHGSILTHLGMLQTRYLRSCPEIEETIQEGLNIARFHQNQAEIAFGLLALAHFHADSMQDFETAVQIFEKSLALFEKVEDDYFIGRATHLIGYCYSFIKGLDELNQYLYKSLIISRKIGDKSSIAMLLTSLSMSYFYIGDFEASQSFAEEAAQLADDIAHGAALAQTDTFLGAIYLLRGQLEKSKMYIELGSSIAREVNFPLPLLFSLAISGVLASFTGNITKSIQYIQECKTFPADPCSATFIHWASALVYCTAGDLDTARGDICTLIALGRKYDTPAMLRLALPVVTLILFQEHKLSLSVEVLAVDQCHPMKIEHWRDLWPIFNEKISGLVDALGPEVYQAAWKRGEKKTTDLILQEVLDCWV